MGVPLRYNFRSLMDRKATTAMTAAGIALAVAVLVISLALIGGLRATFAATGNPLQLIILRKGVTSELNSTVSQAALQEFRTKPQVAMLPDGQPMVSPELVTAINLANVDSAAGMNVTVRGMLPIGLAMREVRMIQGVAFTPGRREVIVGKSIAQRYPDAHLGGTLRFARGTWNVVGVFEGGEMSAFGSEIWCDINQLRSDQGRLGDMSSVLVRVKDRAAIAPLIQEVKNKRLADAEAMTEQAYYAGMTVSGAPLETLGLMVAGIMAIGSAFGTMNTMYAAVARRGREIGTLRALGFSRWSILQSFMFESMLLSLVGGIFGCLLALPLNNVTTGVGNFATFSEVAFAFRVSWGVMLGGLTFAVVIGGLGGFLPARAASRRDLITTLREY